MSATLNLCAGALIVVAVDRRFAGQKNKMVVEGDGRVRYETGRASTKMASAFRPQAHAFLKVAEQPAQAMADW